MAMLTAAVTRGGTNVEFVVGLIAFIVVGFLMAFGALLIGRLVRPTLPQPEKTSSYECGEPAIGSSWVQFDLRFYVVALLFIIFDVEIALFWPWAVVFGGGTLLNAGAAARDEALRQVRQVALYDMLFFVGVIVVGFIYLWRFGYLDWVRASKAGRREAPSVSAVRKTGVVAAKPARHRDAGSESAVPVGASSE